MKSEVRKCTFVDFKYNFFGLKFEYTIISTKYQSYPNLSKIDAIKRKIWDQFTLQDQKKVWP